MPSFQIRKLPTHIYLALKSAADRERRSLSQQAIVVLAKGLDIPIDMQERRKAFLQEIKQETHLWKKWANVDVASWVKEDREQR